MSSVFGNSWSVLALLTTLLVLTLYGAGLRRPFGSLPRIPDVPIRLWHADRFVKISDCAFTAFVLVMMSVLFFRMSILAFLGLSFLFYVAGEMLSHRVKLVPSFYIAIALAACSIALVTIGQNQSVVTAGLIE
jgi:hypothetical protein